LRSRSILTGVYFPNVPGSAYASAFPSTRCLIPLRMDTAHGYEECAVVAFGRLTAPTALGASSK
jgi:hypothetical protein